MSGRDLPSVGVTFPGQHWLVLYFVLAEREAIRYDSWAAALIVAMGPSVFLRTTFFETPTGKAIGLTNIYDRILLWISEKMMIRRYSLFSRFASVIATTTLARVSRTSSTGFTKTRRHKNFGGSSKRTSATNCKAATLTSSSA